MANPIFILDIGPDGVVATHPARVELPVLVAPTPEEKKTTDLNTIRPQLVTLGCMQLPGRGFEFDSSFLGPQSAGRFSKFANLMLRLQHDDEQRRFPPCSVFGHADPTGDDEYNKTLAGRRALSVYGLLTRSNKIWDELYNQPFGGDLWGVRSIRRMLSISLQPAENSFYAGPVEPGNSQAEKDAVEQQTHDAIAAYQESRGLLPPGKGTGVAGPQTRNALYTEYMNAICRDPQGFPFQLDPATDFLSKGKDGAELKGDVQGCGAFNEVFLLSKDQEDEAKNNATLEAVRNELYVVDRRVLVYIFKQGSEIDFKKWPCPRAREDSSGCKLRFWSDYQDRRKRTSVQRTFGVNMDLFERDEGGNLALDGDGNPNPLNVEDTGNTMACRWYHAFAIHSPCERKMEEWVVRIKVDSSKKDPEPLVGRRWVVTAGEENFSAVIRGTTNQRGEIRIPVLDERAVMTLKLDAWGKLFDFDDAAPAGAAAPNADKPAAAAPPAGGDPNSADPDKFPDEDKFLTFKLDAGGLRQMAVTDDELPVKQRLYNLGLGKNAPDKWTKDEFSDAVRQYRRFKGLGKDSTLDDATRAAIENDHELSEPGPLPDDTDGPGGAGTS
jgi:hypothetical protein